jgi:hypothetical protein
MSDHIGADPQAREDGGRPAVRRTSRRERSADVDREPPADAAAVHAFVPSLALSVRLVK